MHSGQLRLRPVNQTRHGTHVKEQNAKLRGAEGQVDGGSGNENAPVGEHGALVVLVKLLANIRCRLALQKPQNLREKQRTKYCEQNASFLLLMLRII